MPTTTTASTITELWNLQARRQMDHMQAYFASTYREEYGPSNTDTYKTFKETTNDSLRYEELDVWIFRNGVKTPFRKMTTKDIRAALRQIEKGWTCLGQQGKYYSLKNELEKRHP